MFLVLASGEYNLHESGEIYQKSQKKKAIINFAIIRRMVFDLKSHRRRNMNEQIDNSSPLSLSKALELIKTREGGNFSKEKVNLAELQRLTGITRGKLRRLRTRGLSPLIRVSDGNPFSCRKAMER